MKNKNGPHRQGGAFVQKPSGVVAVALSLLLLDISMVSAAKRLPSSPPIAKKIPKNLTIHNDTRVDNYYWMNQRDDPEVINYLHEENNYTAAMMEHTEDLQNTLFEEIKGRIKQDDSTVPFLYKNYLYYMRNEVGKAYPFNCRKRNSPDPGLAQEECIDVNQYAEGQAYYSMTFPKFNANEQVAACAFDTVGRRVYNIMFVDDMSNSSSGNDTTATTSTYNETIVNVTSNFAWAEDNKTLFYTKQDPETLRWYQIWRHELGTDPAVADTLVYQEMDDTFSCGVYKTRSDAYILISCQQSLRTEYQYIDAKNPTAGTFQVFLPREGEHEHYIQHAGDFWYINTNDQAENFRLMRTPVGNTTANKTEWTEIIPHRNDTLLVGFDVFADHLVLTERKEGLRQIRIIPSDGTDEHYLEFAEPVYFAAFGTNLQFNTTLLRYQYQSFTTPSSIFDYDMNTRGKTLLKQTEVLGNFSSSDYISERLFAPARDGRRIPISLVYHRDVDPKSNNPLLEYGYGAYGSSLDAYFASSRLSLLNRGFIYAMAHVRGGDEMGRWWYDEGKLLNKMNTFTDFIDVGEFLVEQGYTSPEKLYCHGASAGGLLVGAVVNMAPDLYHGAIAGVPFVDAVTTMLDESIPLTTSEFDEWGNPKDKVYYDYILSYSPYDQVTEQDYPNLLVESGLHDSQVQYWEPTKWVAKLRTHKTDDNLLLLKTNMEAGHGGASGRFERYKKTAFEYAFLLDLASKGTDTTAENGSGGVGSGDDTAENGEDSSSTKISINAVLRCISLGAFFVLV